MGQTVEDEIDSIVARCGALSRFVAMDTSEWTKPLEARLPFRLPPSYIALIRRYRFPSIECAGVTIFGNVCGGPDDLAVRIFRDRVQAGVTQRSGFVQIGNPDPFSYDPICLDMRARAKSLEGSLVRLDHEEILINGRIKILATLSASFLEFFSKLPRER